VHEGIFVFKVDHRSATVIVAQRRRSADQRHARSTTMTSRILTLAIALAVGVPSLAEEPMRVGMVYVVGNTVTRDQVIRETIELEPGRYLRPADMRSAEARLAALGIFASGQSRPRVTVIEGESTFKDIIVTVKEKSTSSWRTSWTLTPWDGPVLHVVWEERNFDPWRWPVCWDDIIEGRAFRGANQNVRIETTLNARQCVSIADHMCSVFSGLR
jgi:outer membrane protein assembly factor BamA